MAASCVVLAMSLVLVAFVHWVGRPRGTACAAYVISLRDGRRSRGVVEARFREREQPFEFVDAVDGREVAGADADRFDPKYEWKAGEIGCALSHVRLWTRLAGTGIDAPVLVFEDDAKLPRDWLPRVREVVDRLDDTIDLVFLGHCLETRGAPWKGSDALRRSECPRCTHGYLVTPRGATKLAAWARTTATLELPIDEELALACVSGRLQCLSHFPPLVTTFDEPSTIRVRGGTTTDRT